MSTHRIPPEKADELIQILADYKHTQHTLPTSIPPRSRAFHENKQRCQQLVPFLHINSHAKRTFEEMIYQNVVFDSFNGPTYSRIAVERNAEYVQEFTIITDSVDYFRRNTRMMSQMTRLQKITIKLLLEPDPRVPMYHALDHVLQELPLSIRHLCVTLAAVPKLQWQLCTETYGASHQENGLLDRRLSCFDKARWMRDLMRLSKLQILEWSDQWGCMPRPQFSSTSSRAEYHRFPILKAALDCLHLAKIIWWWSSSEFISWYADRESLCNTVSDLANRMQVIILLELRMLLRIAEPNLWRCEFVPLPDYISCGRLLEGELHAMKLFSGNTSSMHEVVPEPLTLFLQRARPQHYDVCVWQYWNRANGIINEEPLGEAVRMIKDAVQQILDDPRDFSFTIRMMSPALPHKTAPHSPLMHVETQISRPWTEEKQTSMMVFLAAIKSREDYFELSHTNDPPRSDVDFRYSEWYMIANDLDPLMTTYRPSLTLTSKIQDPIVEFDEWMACEEDLRKSRREALGRKE